MYKNIFWGVALISLVVAGCAKGTNLPKQSLDANREHPAL